MVEMVKLRTAIKRLANDWTPLGEIFDRLPFDKIDPRYFEQAIREMMEEDEIAVEGGVSTHHINIRGFNIGQIKTMIKHHPSTQILHTPKRPKRPKPQARLVSRETTVRTTVTQEVTTRETFAIPKLNLPQPQEFDAQFYNEIRSSVVHYLDYFPETKVVQVQLGATWYWYEEVPEKIFNDWRMGDAHCKTNDFMRRKRWWKGKYPSLGAFYNQKIKGRYTMHIGRYR